MFSINPKFGIITTRKQLDHESQSVVVLTVQSQLGSSPAFSSTQINVTITDVNDNPPIFLRESEKISLHLNTPPGSAFYIAQAQDIDSGYNALISYSIASENQDVFVIDPNLGILYLNTTLSMVCEHILLITAEDNGHPTLSSLLTLTISVTKPETISTLTFGNLVHRIEINEDFAVYSTILQVQAFIEGAQSQPSRIVYSLLPETSVPFAIHRNTGWIFLRQSLDYERTNIYNLIVVASCEDYGEEQTASASVIVKVLDVNDNSPTFNQNMYFFTAMESSSPIGVIGTITASDIDSGKNGQISFFLLSKENYFQISSKTGNVTLLFSDLPTVNNS